MIFPFDKEKLDFLKELNLPFDPSKDLTDDEICDLEEIVADHLSFCGLDENGNPTKGMLMCESIIDFIYDNDPANFE